MTNFLLTVSLVLTILFGYWIMSKLDRALDSDRTEDEEADGHKTP